MQEKSHHRAYRHGDVVCQSVVTDTFAPSRGGHDVDHHGIACHGNRAEGDTVNHTEQNENCQRSGKQISDEYGGENEVSKNIEWLTGKRVEQVAREGADRKSGNRVARKYDADHRALCGKNFGQIEG